MASFPRSVRANGLLPQSNLLVGFTDAHTKMIHPMISPPGGACSGIKRSAVFYSITLLLAFSNFFPLLVESKLEDVPVPPSTEFYLSICYFLSLPLLFEFIVDVVVSCISSSTNKTAEPRFGHFLILISMFIPIVTIGKDVQDGVSRWKVLSIICLMSFLQSLIIIGQYGKLQFRTIGHWRTSTCIGITFLYIFSQICLNLGIAYHTRDFSLTVEQRWCIGCGFICAVGCLTLHCLNSKRFIINLMYGYFQGDSPLHWQVDDVAAVALQCIIFVSFLLNCFAGFGLIDTGNFHSQTNSVVINHIVLGLGAAIIPGRVMRKNFMVLNDKMAVKETFIRYVSHEIRSPLSTTSLGLNYLLDRLKAGEIKLSEVLEVVQESVVTCELAMNTLNDFLMLDKIQSNMVEINTTMRQASDFLMEAVRPFSLQASSCGITLVCSAESSTAIRCVDAKIDIDTYKMNQVLRNLLSNAFKFTPSGGSVSVTMTIQEYADQSLKSRDVNKYVDGRRHCVKFSVKDSGCGISAENLPKLFGQYVQFDAAKLQGGKGSGLGLWLSKAIVEMHGGRIGAESEGEGRGCIFWFEVPCVLVNHSVEIEYCEESCALITSIDITSCGPTSSACPVKLVNHLEMTDLENDLESCLRVQSPVLVEDNDCILSDRINRSTDLNVATPQFTPTNKRCVDLHSDIWQSSKLVARYKVPQFDDCISQHHITKQLRQEMTALLVDDSAIARKMVERSLATIGVVCIHAVNGREAVEKVRQSMNSEDPAVGYDVILMDHYMPEMSGPEAVEVIRNELGYKGVIMGVSGNASTDSDFGKLLVEGRIDKVFVKPFNLEMFVDFFGK